MEPHPSAVDFLSADEHSVALRLLFERDPSGVAPDLFEARVVTSGVTCEHTAETLNGDGLDIFFAGLVEDWKRWDGTRRWNAIDGRLSIEALHHGHVIELLFVLSAAAYQPDAWQLRLPIFLLPGEQLRQAARAVARLFEDSP